MRLTLLSRDAPPMAGGIADHTGILANRLALAGDEVTLITRAGAGPIEGVEVWSHPDFDRVPSRALAAVLASTKPDAVLWAYNPFSFGRRGLARRAKALAPELRRHMPETRIVILAHELTYPRGVGGAKGRLWRGFQEEALRAVVSSSDAFIVTTPDRMGVAGAKTVCIPVGSNLPDVLVTAQIKADTRRKLGVPEDAFVVVHLGGVGPGRDIATGLDALIDLAPDVHLVLAGDTGPFDFHSSMEARVHAFGREEPEELAQDLAASDIYLHLDPVGPTPGRRTTLVAALQSGLPIIAFEGEQTDSRMVDAGCVRLVPPRDPAALALGIAEMRADASERARLGHNARALFEKEFAWSRITDQVRAVLTGSAADSDT